jgi:hypothetical protein
MLANCRIAVNWIARLYNRNESARLPAGGIFFVGRSGLQGRSLDIATLSHDGYESKDRADEHGRDTAFFAEIGGAVAALLKRPGLFNNSPIIELFDILSDETYAASWGDRRRSGGGWLSGKAGCGKWVKGGANWPLATQPSPPDLRPAAFY